MSLLSSDTDQPTFSSPFTVRHDDTPVDPSRPTAAFVGISWLALATGAGGYLLGLWNARMELSDKGYYLTLLLYGLFAAVTVQKAVRDRQEKVPVTALFSALAWGSVLVVATLLVVGLWNADLLRSEKGFYAMAMALATFGSVAVQKNVRDLARTAPQD